MPFAAPLPEAKRKLLDQLVERRVVTPREESIIPKRAPAQNAPLALAQEQLLIREQKANRIPLYNECFTLKFMRQIDPGVLEASLVEVIRRHEIWRTAYETIGGQLVQVIAPAPERFELPFIDLRRRPEWQRKSDARRLSLAQACRSFDLRSGPLLRAILIAMSECEYWLVMTAHQSIIDGVSVYQILPKELSAIYQAFAAGLSSPLPELTLQFSDYASWQRAYVSAAQESKQIENWRTKLAGDIPRLKWPARKSSAGARTFHGYIREFLLDRCVADAARAVTRQNGTTMFTILLAAFYTLLRFYTDQTDLTVGTLSPSGRKRSEVQDLLGYFLNPVALRVDLSDDPPFSELLHRVQVTVSEAISNDDVPFERVAEALAADSDSGRNPFFDVAISLQPCTPSSAGACVTSMDAENGGSAFDLYVAFIDRPEGLHARVQYNPDVFEFEDMQRMVEDFESLLALAAARPESRVSQLRPR